MDNPGGLNQLQAVREELSRLQTELDETAVIKREAEAVNDPDLVADCVAAETRLKGLVEQLNAKAATLQKASGAEALRARLQQLKTSEARARTLLGGAESQPATQPGSQAATLTSEGSATSGPFPALSQRSVSGGSAPISPSPSQRSTTSAAREKSASPGWKPEASAGGFPTGAPQGQAWQSGFGEPSAFLPSPRTLPQNPPPPTNGHNAGQLRSPQLSLDSFGDSAFSGIDPVRSSSAGSASAPKPAAAAPAAGFESAAFGQPKAQPKAPAPAADFGFGESAFGPPGPSAAAPKSGRQDSVDMTDAGRSISFKDSYPTGTNTQSAARQQASQGAASWHAFPTASPQAPAPAQADKLPLGFPWAASEQTQGGSRPGSSRGGFEESAFASSPTTSARSGNPFADPSEPARPFSPDFSVASESAQPAPVPTVFADPFASGGSGQHSDPFSPFPPSFDTQPQPATGAAQRAHPFGSPHHSHFPASSGAPHFTMPSGQQYVVTPSMVIPEADWEAAFSAPKPTQAEKTDRKQPPGGQPVINEADEEAETAAPSKEQDVWVPMTEQGRSRLFQEFQSKYGGKEVGLADARELHARGGIKEPLERVFAVADLDGNGKLSYAEFLLFMYLLKVLQKGVALPRVLSNERVSFLLGVDLPSLGWSGKRSGGLPQPPVRVETSSLDALRALGASEEDAKRALFLSGEDVDAARQWLAERNKLGGTGAGSSESRPKSAGRGGRQVNLRIEKAILNYKKPVDRPLFQVTVRDAWGEAVGQPVDTPPANYDRNSGVFTAGHTVLLDTPADELPEGAVVYFELKHWKSKEKKWSTLAWTFVAKEAFLKMVDGQTRVRNEAQGMHLYEKPLDPRSHFRQGSMRKLKPLSETPDFFLRVSEYQA